MLAHDEYPQNTSQAIAHELTPDEGEYPDGDVGLDPVV
jgi:hypothetical protein